MEKEKKKHRKTYKKIKEIKILENELKEIKVISDKTANKKKKPVINETKFREFFESESFSPVLRQVNKFSGNVDLEQVAETTPTPTPNRDEKKEKGESSYLPSLEQKNEPKYAGGTNFIEYAKIETVSREQIFDRKRELFERAKVDITPMRKATEQIMYEKYEPAEKFDIEKEGKKDIFKKPEVKYKASR